MILGRTPSGAIKTKSDGGGLRAVNCACCVTELCCMYPAQGLFDGFYTPQDLPTTLFVDNFDASFLMDAPAGSVIVNGVMNLTDVNGEFPYYNIDVDGLYGPDNFYAAPNNLTEGFWFYDLGQGVIGGIQLQCLINEITSDQFADTYTISGPVSGTVTRESVCVWRGPNLRLTNFGFQWKVNENNKSGFQNTPVGSYGGSYTVS
jgi:hypothetical protein